MVSAREIYSELKAVTKPIHRGKVKNFLLGENKSLRVGNGYEIRNIREWQPGDPLEHIDFEASLPAWPKKVFILEMFETKNAPLIMVADISRSVFVGLQKNANKFNLLLQSIGALGIGASRLRDPVGVLCFSDKVEFYLPPKLGFSWLFVSASRIFKILKKSGRPTGASSNLNQALGLLIRKCSRRQCSIVILSDFADIINGHSELDYRIIKKLSALNNFNVIAILLDEPGEFAWEGGSGTVLIKDAETGRFDNVKTARAREIRQIFISRREKLRKQLKEVGVDSLVLNFGDRGDHFNRLAQFLSQRKTANI